MPFVFVRAMPLCASILPLCLSLVVDVRKRACAVGSYDNFFPMRRGGLSSCGPMHSIAVLIKRRRKKVAIFFRTKEKKVPFRRKNTLASALKIINNQTIVARPVLENDYS